MSSSILFPTNQYTTSSKSSQQIQRLMIPEDIPESEIISYLLNKNHPLQMVYVYRNFHKYWKGVIGTICQKASMEQPQNQIIICESLKVILLKEKQVSLNDLDSIFSMTLQSLNNLNSIANEPLAQILQLLLKVHPSKQQILTKIQCQIIQLGKSTQPTISKVTSGRLITIISKHIGKMIKGQMIDILKRILTDNQVEARKVWVTEIFPKLLEGLDLDFVQLHLQEKIYQCVYDQNQEIGQMSLKVILKNATRFSIQQQSSRIVKLFIDSLTSKNQRICIMVTEIMGQVYQKLINIIMKNQSNCNRFWRSLVELAQCKNQKILNHFIYNLPGILLISSKFHRTDPFVDIFCQLFYDPMVNKNVLISYFHQIVYLYPHKKQQLKEVIYWIFGELFDQDEQDYDIQALKIINSFIKNINKSKSVFFQPNLKNVNLKQNNSITNFQQNSLKYSNVSSSQRNFLPKPKSSFPNYEETTQSIQGNIFEHQFCDYLFKYLQLLQYHKNSQWLNLYFQTIKEIAEYLPLEWIQKAFLPKLYNSIKTRSGPLELMIQIMTILLKKDVSNLMNFYASKIHVEFSKSNKSHQRQASIQFIYYCSYYFSMQTYQQYKLGQKFLAFHSDKSFQNRYLFIKYLQRLQYFFNKQQKLESTIIISRLLKDNDPEIVQMISDLDFNQSEKIKQILLQQSKLIKEKEKQNLLTGSYLPIKSLKPLFNNKRQSKDLKKQDVLKKRIQTSKSKTKMLIKDIPKKKTLNFGTPSIAMNKTLATLKRNS